MNALGQHLDSIEKNTLSFAGTSVKVKPKVKRSRNPASVKTHVPLSHSGKVKHDASVTPCIGYIPPPDRLRQEMQIQEQVQESLRHLAENTRPGKEKIKSQKEGGALKCLSNIGSNGPMNLFRQGRIRAEYNQLSPIQWMAGFGRTL